MPVNSPILRSRKPSRRRRRHRDDRKPFNRIFENDLIRKVSYHEYQQKVRSVYGGPKGAVLATCSLISLHEPLGERMFRTRRFDLSGAQRILDVGSGAGQIARHLTKYADPGAQITCTDLSLPMLRRARMRLRGDRQPRYVTADVARLPFADQSFDCVTCGWVLEYLPDPRSGLSELARVLETGGRMLLMATEDNFAGACTSRLWCCRTYNRHELRETCESLGLHWERELWYTRVHRVFRAGGIGVEIVKR